MAKGKREPFGQRIYNAIRALRGDPWPQVFEFAAPPMVVGRPLDIQTIAYTVEIDKCDARMMDPDIMLNYATDRICIEFANALKDFNVVEIIRDDGSPWDKCIRYAGRLQVVVPEKKEEPNEYQSHDRQVHH